MFSLLSNSQKQILEQKSTPAFFKQSNNESLKQPFFKPAIKVDAFSPLSTTSNPGADKSTATSTEDQDQSANLTSLTAVANGVSIKVNGDGVYTSSDYPDGFRWTQTITTNANKGGPLLTTPVTYVDPKPNDDTKPFYWTDAEEATNAGVFSDNPTRNPRPSGTVVWDAILSLNGVNGKNVKRFDSLTYGFEVDSAGVVTVHQPASPGSVAGHIGTLSSEFPDWSFS